MSSDKTVTERLDLFINELGENANSFSGKIGVTRSTIAGAISRNKGVNTDLLQKISDVFPSINLDWLITGEGSMLKNNAATEINRNIISGDNTTTNSHSNFISDNSGSVNLGDHKTDANSTHLKLENALLIEKIEELKKNIADRDKIIIDKDKTISDRDKIISIYEKMIKHKE